MLKPLHKSLLSVVWTGLLVTRGFAATGTPENVVLARADMPNRFIPQAEIRLVKRGEEMVVQSAILPRFPDKVLKKITSSEQKNWPCNSDSATYIDALDAAFTEYLGEYNLKTTALVIDFVSNTESNRVDFFFAPAERDETGIVLQTAPIWKSLILSDDYIKKNQQYILADAFGKEAATLLGTLRNSASTENENGR